MFPVQATHDSRGVSTAAPLIPVCVDPMVKLLKYCKYVRLTSSRVSHHSGWHLPSLLFAFCWFLVALFLLTAVWKFLSFFFLTHLSWSDTDSYAGWDSWTPPVNLLSEPTWGIRQWWPTYVAKKIIPSRGSTVVSAVFTNVCAYRISFSRTSGIIFLFAIHSYGKLVIHFDAELTL